MRSTLLAHLACPDCYADLTFTNVVHTFEVQDVEHVADGVLSCASGHAFPVIDEVPRLVPQADLTADEKASLARLRTTARRPFAADLVSPGVAEERLRAASREAWGPERRAAWEGETAYKIAEYHGRNKRRHVKLLRNYGISPTSILDIGGGIGGFSRALWDEFHPNRAVVADVTAGYSFGFKTEQRNIDLVRADALRLPFRPGSFDLVVSAFLLEHVSNWQGAVENMARVARHRIFLAFGPNRWFPYELGHLDVPLAGTLPKALARYVVYAWWRMTGRARPLWRVDELLNELSHVSSLHFRRWCRSLGFTVHNAFGDFVMIATDDNEAPRTSLRQLLRRLRHYRRVARATAVTLASLGLEPQMYYLLGMPESRAERRSGGVHPHLERR
jgi:SAM-dependent methyltransferase/uncharacterized protein YbaR (Trm112 family)